MSANATTERLLRPAEVCERLAISRATLYRAVERGALPAIKVFGQLRFDAHELERWLYSEEDKA